MEKGKTQGSPAQPATDTKSTDKSLLNQDAKPEGAPDAYTDFKAPDGFEIDADAIKEAAPIFKEMNLSQAQAQKLVDFYAKQSAAAADAPYEAFSALRERWQGEIKADPVLGSKLPQVRETISRALDSLGDSKITNEFREAMDLTGAGDNPAFIRAFYKLAQLVTEGKHVSGTGPATTGQRAPGAAPPSAAKALYPNLP